MPLATWTRCEEAGTLPPGGQRLVIEFLAAHSLQIPPDARNTIAATGPGAWLHRGVVNHLRGKPALECQSPVLGNSPSHLFRRDLGNLLFRCLAYNPPPLTVPQFDRDVLRLQVRLQALVGQLPAQPALL